MKVLLSLIVALGILPAPVSFERADGTSTAKDVEVVVGKRSFTRWSAFLPEYARKEAYRLTITPKQVRIEANTLEGVFRANTTLAQLERPLPCGVIIDYPRFAWRGIMLDISRHFRDKEFILKQIDALSEVKLNVLHLHLTDAAGWRLEVKSHPELTAKAAWRVGDTWREWDTTGKRYEGSYGGFLSQDDVREIVAYAAERHMTVVPEIEMPGHSRETVYAVPGVGCKDTSDDLCPGKEATFKLLEDVLTEVMDLFPSEYIHIGGDEAGKRDWHDCPDCRRRMQEEGLTSVEELQSYLVRRIEKFLNAHGRRLIGWDEILEGGLSPNATVMSWRGTEGGLEAIRQGHDAVMTPGNRCYLDKVQDAPVREPEGWGGYLPIDSIFVYDPAAGIPEASLGHLLGVQGNLWHELIPQPSHTEYMLYPRAFAIAEIGWSPVDVKDAVDFRERARRTLRRSANAATPRSSWRRRSATARIPTWWNSIWAIASRSLMPYLGMIDILPPARPPSRTETWVAGPMATAAGRASRAMWTSPSTWASSVRCTMSPPPSSGTRGPGSTCPTR